MTAPCGRGSAGLHRLVQRGFLHGCVLFPIPSRVVWFECSSGLRATRSSLCRSTTISRLGALRTRSKAAVTGGRRRGVREKSWWRLTHLRKDNHSASPQTDSLTIRCDSTCSLVPQIAFDSHPYIPARVSSHRNRASREDAFWPFDCVADGTARYGATRILWCGEDAECQPDERYSNLGF
jgi:hypothetical protein